MWFLIACSSSELTLDGIDDYRAVELHDVDGPAITIEAWIYPEEGGAPRQNILARRDPKEGNDAFTFRLRQDWGGVLELGLAAQGGTWGTFGKIKVPPSQWSFVTVTHDRQSRQVCFFVNAQPDRCDQSRIPPGKGELPTWIGGDPLHGPKARPFKGKIKGMRVWTSLRTAAEIQADMAGGAGGIELK